VVRLKSGDPLIFGRAGEEIEALRRSNIAYEIVPGVTCALGAAAAAGIPLTYRRISSTLVLTVGHRAAGNSDAEWGKFSATESTLLVYMPGHDYAEMADRLTAAGFAKETLCAIISRATTPRQQIHHTTISNLHRSPELAAPTLLVVGEVVKFADHAAGQPEKTFPVMESAFAATRVQSAISSERLRQEERFGMKENISQLQTAAESWTPERVLGWAFDTFGSAVAISSAFGAEGMVLIDIASRVRRNFRLFTLDTEFLFPETYNLMDQVETEVRHHD